MFRPAPIYVFLRGSQASVSGEFCEGVRAMHKAGPAPSGDFWFLLVASKGTRRRHDLEGKGKRKVCPCIPVFSHKSFVFLLLRPFSYARKKKDQKEARPSAGGRFFRESLRRHKRELGGLPTLQLCQCECAGRIRTEKPPIPPVASCEMH